MTEKIWTIVFAITYGLLVVVYIVVAARGRIAVDERESRLLRHIETLTAELLLERIIHDEEKAG